MLDPYKPKEQKFYEQQQCVKVKVFQTAKARIVCDFGGAIC
jgi:hypothetical protein